jgi:hypothetical protein
MKIRNEIIKMLMATVSESRLYDHFDVRMVVEGFADQLVLFNDERCKQVAVMQAEFDANIAALRREMAFVNSNFDGALKRLFLSLQGGLSESSDVIDQFMSQLADTHAEYATKLAQVKEEFDREIAALMHRWREALPALDRLESVLVRHVWRTSDLGATSEVRGDVATGSTLKSIAARRPARDAVHDVAVVANLAQERVHFLRRRAYSASIDPPSIQRVRSKSEWQAELRYPWSRSHG